MLFHSENITFANFLYDIFGGISYWFTSALFVAQIVLFILFLSRSSNITFYLLATFVIFLLGIWLNSMITPNGSADAYFPWFYRTGLEYTFIMALGGVYLKVEKQIDKFISPILLFMLGVFYTLSLLLTYNTGLLRFMGVGGRINVGGFVVIIVGILLVVGICKKIPYNKYLSFIGKNSIVFYFLSGATSAFIGKITGMLLSEKLYIATLTVAFFVFMC